MQRREIVEILIKNYLSKEWIYSLEGLVLVLKEKDFNSSAKDVLEELLEPGRITDYSIAPRLLSVSQIRKSIPLMWRIVNTDIATMRPQNLDILASLARMNEKKASALLCNYYNSIKNKTNYNQVFIAKHLAFSLDSIVLDCLISDYKSIDIKLSFRDGDSGYSPSQALGGAITSMLRDYPYTKGEYLLDTKQLLDWLNKASSYQLEEK